MMSNARKLVVLGGKAYLSEASALFSAMAVKPNSARKDTINTLIATLKDKGIWPLLDTVWVPAAHDRQAARLNWKNPGTFDLIEADSDNLTFATDRGFTGNGSSSYLKTGFIPSTHAVQMVQDSAHVGAWSRSETDSANVLVGGRTGASSRQILLNPSNGTQGSIRLNQDAGGVAISNAFSAGHFIGRRNSSSQNELFRNGASVNTSGSATSTGLPTVEIYLGALNTNGTASSFDTREIAAAHIGATLTNQQVADLYAALLVYMQAVGAI